MVEECAVLLQKQSASLDFNRVAANTVQNLNDRQKMYPETDHVFFPVPGVGKWGFAATGLAESELRRFDFEEYCLCQSLVLKPYFWSMKAG